MPDREPFIREVNATPRKLTKMPAATYTASRPQMERVKPVTETGPTVTAGTVSDVKISARSRK